ncbi:FUSC family protein [Flammeovirga sp. SubArs3]|uniref:FUSC family protein n=1 Tax=Flammeovirga sp. SubArs3 TaxID=2995316 RepID=UPI00248B4A92|nr:FUSC family protein [Flammeovirga sp. SubArs3]
MDINKQKIELWIYSNLELVHLLKLMVLVVSTFIGAKLLEIPHGSWISGTCLVLNRPVVELGGVINRVSQRVSGTIFGAGMSLFTLFWFPDNLLIHSLALGVAFPLFSIFIFKSNKYAYQVAILTMLIVLSIGDGWSYEAAYWRSINIAVGGVISVIFIFLLPIHAKKEWRFELSKCLLLISNLYEETLKGDQEDRQKLFEDNTDIITSVRKQRKIFPFVVKESSHFKSHKNEMEDVALRLRKLSGILELLASSVFHSDKGNHLITQLSSIHDKKEIIQSHLHKMSDELLHEHKVTENTEKLVWRSSKLELLKLNEQNLHQEAPLSPYSYIWLNNKFGEEVMKLEENLYILF